jgi:putative ABC transport system substrate-binding protein
LIYHYKKEQKMQNSTSPTNLNKFKIPVYILLFSILTFSLYHLFFSNSHKNKDKPLICISQIISHPALDASREGLIAGLQQAGYINGQDIRVETALAQGKLDTSSQIAQKFVGENPDVIVAISTPSAQTAAVAAKTTQIPVVFSCVSYPVQAKLVNSIEKPGGHVTGVSDFTKVADHFKFFREIMPKIKKIGLIYNPGEANSATMVEESRAVAKQMGIEVVASPAMKTGDVAAATQKLIGSVDAIFINNDNTALGAFDVITTIADRTKLPVFVSDTDMITKEHGGLAALGCNQYVLGQQAAKAVIRILKGEKPANIPVEFAQTMETKINLGVAKKLGIIIPPEVVKRAKVVEEG